MHQEHNIPWNILHANFTFIEDNHHVTPRRTALHSKQRHSQAKELNHFVRVFSTTITTFSETERKKYPGTFDTPLSGKIFSDEIRDRHPEFLNERNQQIEYWISARSRSWDGDSLVYTTSHGKLADVVKVLLYENQMEALLMLANHPRIPLSDLQHLSWGHHFGFSRVAEAGALMYIFINALATTQTLDRYQELSCYAGIVKTVTDSMDYCAQQIPHQRFLLDPDRGNFCLRDNPLGDLPKVKEYLKELFKLLYLYDMLVRECRKSPRWDSEICWAMHWVLGVNVEYCEVDEGHRVHFV